MKSDGLGWTDKILAIAAGIGLALMYAAVIASVGGGTFYLLWNYAVVQVFHAQPVNFWQAVALWFLVGVVGNIFRS